MDSEEPCEVADHFVQLGRGHIVHDGLCRVGIVDCVESFSHGITKERIEELSFADRFHACIVTGLGGGCKGKTLILDGATYVLAEG